MLAEYGYERNPERPLLVPNHRYCDGKHTRRGAGRGAFCGLGVVHGFDNTWWPFHPVLDEDQEGVEYLLHLRRFFTWLVPFPNMRPAPGVIVDDERAPGGRPLALATPGLDEIVVYLPTGGSVILDLPETEGLRPRWFDPRTGRLHPAKPGAANASLFVSPQGGSGRPHDWVLPLSGTTTPEDQPTELSDRQPL